MNDINHEADVQGRMVASGGKAIGAEAESLGGGEMMPIAPMSAAQAPIQCKSKEDKDKSTIQKYENKGNLSPKEQKKLDSARASMTKWAGQTEQKLGGKKSDQMTAEERSTLSKASTFLNAEAQRKLSSIPSDQMNLAVQGMLAAEMNKKLAAHFGNSPDSIQARASGEAKSPAAVIQRQFSPELQGYPAQFQAPSGTVRFS